MYGGVRACMRIQEGLPIIYSAAKEISPKNNKYKSNLYRSEYKVPLIPET
jgi:hypothetical protein